jgi:hypothetical protein
MRLAKTAIFSFSSLPLSIFGWIGWIAFIAFLGVTSYSLYCKWFTELAVPGWTSQLVAMTFFAALNALGISMLGEYVVRIYDQVRGRPLYLVDRTVNFTSETDGILAPDAAPELSASAIDLDELDPLNLDTRWDDAYQHLLAQANDLLELGELARAETDEFAEQLQGTNEGGELLNSISTRPPIRQVDGTDDEPPDVVQFYSNHGNR